MKSLCKSSVFACAIACTKPSIFPFSFFIFVKTFLTNSSSEAPSNTYALLPLNSDIKSSIFSLFSSPIYVNINFAPFSYADFAIPKAILHLFLIPIINIVLFFNIFSSLNFLKITYISKFIISILNNLFFSHFLHCSNFI